MNPLAWLVDTIVAAWVGLRRAWRWWVGREAEARAAEARAREKVFGSPAGPGGVRWWQASPARDAAVALAISRGERSPVHIALDLSVEEATGLLRHHSGEIATYLAVGGVPFATIRDKLQRMVAIINAIEDERASDHLTREGVAEQEARRP